MRTLFAVGVFALSLAACSGKSAQSACPPDCDMSSAIDQSTSSDLTMPQGTLRFHFIMNTVVMPDSSVATKRFQYDVDGDGSVENKLGNVDNAIKTVGGIDPQGAVDTELMNGSLVQLLQVQTMDPNLMNDTLVGVGGFVGNTAMGADPTMNFNGHAAIDVDLSEEPASHFLQGPLIDGKASTLHLPPGSFPIHLPISTSVPLVHMTLYAAHVEFQAASANGQLTLGAGMLNGGLKATEIHDRLIPAIAQMLDNIVQMNPTSQQAQNILQQFDTPKAWGNQDGHVEASEVENNPIVMALLSPDLDLFDAQGNLAPNSDGVRDSLSFGVGFTAVQAMFPDQQ